jgi:hypothetical protein
VKDMPQIKLLASYSGRFQRYLIQLFVVNSIFGVFHNSLAMKLSAVSGIFRKRSLLFIPQNLKQILRTSF